MSSSEISELSVDEALKRLEEGSALFMDVRDSGSFRRGHVPGAVHIGDHNVADFVRETDKDKAVFVYCYHWNSSIGGASYLEENGFSEVYSMRGGFTDWGERPTETLPEPEPRRPKPARTQENRPNPEVGNSAVERPRRRGLRRVARALVRRLRDS